MAEPEDDYHISFFCTPKVLNFSRTPTKFDKPSGVTRDALNKALRPRTHDGKLLTAKQIRARARRRARRAERIMTEEEFQAMYKPLEEWDMEELSRGRPRNAQGHFRGPAPKWITRDTHERAMDLFKQAIRSDLNATTVDAMTVLQWVLTNEQVDEKGKYLVPPSAKLDAAKFLIEHVVGKPTQRLETDVSVKLQGILGVAMANPAEALMPGHQGGEGYNLGHLPGVTMPLAERPDRDDDVLEGEWKDDG